MCWSWRITVGSGSWVRILALPLTSHVTWTGQSCPIGRPWSCAWCCHGLQCLIVLVCFFHLNSKPLFIQEAIFRHFHWGLVSYVHPHARKTLWNSYVFIYAFTLLSCFFLRALTYFWFHSLATLHITPVDSSLWQMQSVEENLNASTRRKRDKNPGWEKKNPGWQSRYQTDTQTGLRDFFAILFLFCHIHRRWVGSWLAQ